MKTIYKLLFGIFIIPFATSCMNYLDKDPIGFIPQEELDAAPTYNSVVYSVNPAYKMLSSTLNLIGNWAWNDGTVTRNDFVLYDIASDDALKKWNPDGDQPWMDEVHNYSYIASNAAFNGFWNYQYVGVQKVNSALSLLEDDKVVELVGLEGDLRKRLLGEAYFLRAFYYFDLVTNFGDVPLITKPIDNFKEAYEKAQRVDQNLVWEQINTDLKMAVESLPNSKYSSETEPWRVSRTAALAMQAKVSLYKKDYSAVKSIIQIIENDNYYSLNDNYFDAFSVEHEYAENEAIFTYNHEEKKTPKKGNGLCALLGWGFLAPSESFINEFEPNDPRLAYTVNTSTKTIYKLLGDTSDKYQGNDDAPSNKIYIRYADVLLWKAEALIETENVSQGIEVINQVRERARNTVRVDGTKAPAGTLDGRDKNGTKVQAMEWLIHERRVELGFESHRLRDLKRWGIAKDVLNKNGQPYKDYHYLAPIPQKDIDKSGGLLTQNPDY